MKCTPIAKGSEQAERLRKTQKDSERLEENRGLLWLKGRCSEERWGFRFLRRQMPPILVTLGCKQLWATFSMLQVAIWHFDTFCNSQRWPLKNRVVSHPGCPRLCQFCFFVSRKAFPRYPSVKKLGGLVCQLVPLFLFYLVVSLAKIVLGSEIGIFGMPDGLNSRLMSTINGIGGV